MGLYCTWYCGYHGSYYGPELSCILKIRRQRIGRVQNIEDTIIVEILWKKDKSINSVHVRHFKLKSPESYLGKRVSWKGSSGPAEGEIVRKIAMQKEKRNSDCLQKETLDVHLLTPIRTSQLPQLSESFVTEMISQTNDMEFPEFEDPSGSSFSPVRLETEAVAENADAADNETNNRYQTTCHVCRKTFRGKNICINSKKLCHKYCCAYDTQCSFQTVICKDCSGKMYSRNCFVENCFNSCAFFRDGCWQFLCDHPFAEDRQECRKLTKKFRSHIVPRDKVTTENSPVCTWDSECNASGNEQETLSDSTSGIDLDDPLADLMGKTGWKRNLYETSKFDFDQNKRQYEKQQNYVLRCNTSWTISENHFYQRLSSPVFCIRSNKILTHCSSYLQQSWNNFLE